MDGKYRWTTAFGFRSHGEGRALQRKIKAAADKADGKGSLNHCVIYHCVQLVVCPLAEEANDVDALILAVEKIWLLHAGAPPAAPSQFLA